LFGERYSKFIHEVAETHTLCLDCKRVIRCSSHLYCIIIIVITIIIIIIITIIVNNIIIITVVIVLVVVAAFESKHVVLCEPCQAGMRPKLQATPENMARTSITQGAGCW
jgi:c-di-AMP phosphodiesterase-like protein